MEAWVLPPSKTVSLAIPTAADAKLLAENRLLADVPAKEARPMRLSLGLAIGLLHADLRIGRSQLALRLTDIRPTAQEI